MPEPTASTLERRLPPSNAHENAGPALMREPQCLLREATLADARFATDKEESPVAVDRVVEPRTKRLELPFTPDEGTRSRARSNGRLELD